MSHCQDEIDGLRNQESTVTQSARNEIDRLQRDLQAKNKELDRQRQKEEALVTKQEELKVVASNLDRFPQLLIWLNLLQNDIQSLRQKMESRSSSVPSASRIQEMKDVLDQNEQKDRTIEKLSAEKRELERQRDVLKVSEHTFKLL